ncbi:Sodium-coupled monocarboxylate transporter 2 [Cricetulus griseus]|uniref:Sodium-coupled monocarboxylate transporter 2 n=1 Tax=Cricetulus griseus TaxID=10029 RepID=G3HSS0_CRIGR|nr:Sodium-coupled monocarboxylate transporter 2 [Cricetulus griseus]
MAVKSFEAWDYVVFAGLFVISSGIGVFFAIKERKKATSREFLVGGRQMSFGPVALSLTASFMSAVTVLGTPAEVYRFGASFFLFIISYAFVVFFTSELFLPVFYRSGITSTYEYLQLRFNKPVRYAATVIYIVQTVLYTGVVVYAPALALNQVCAIFCGLIMYSNFKDCDPWTSGAISAPDQLMPYFVMEIFATMPGLPGLFVACAFSGTLSTVAASINALATVTFEDFVKSCFPHLSDKKSTWISKGLCLLFGILCTSMAVVASFMGSVVQAALSILGMCGGPMLGLFTLGIVFPFVNWKGALGGLLTGITLSFWVAIGAFVYPAPESKTLPLPLSTELCAPSNITTTVGPQLSSRPPLADTWYSLSYLYYSAVGFLGCIIAGLIISLVTGRQRGKDIDPLLIRPVCNLFCFWSKKYKTLCWCGVQHDQETEEDYLDSGSTWKQGAESALQNGFKQESLAQIPDYNSKDKNYSNSAQKTTHF